MLNNLVSISIGHLHFLVLDRDLARVRGLSTPSMIIRPSARKLMLSGSSFCARVKHNRTRSSCRKTNSTTGQQRCTTSYTTWASRRCRRCHSRPKNNDKDRDRDRDKATCCLLIRRSIGLWVVVLMMNLSPNLVLDLDLGLTEPCRPPGSLCHLPCWERREGELS
ncbi:uncharacterized protein RAG0_08557 [Rhynchosporium agropyri]|uniref:Uncharacterized protein n=1 Tax=Rhynchosporium agropyri TaxID=914238 RepID=A0A1E1KRE3_9HELO|nr:uncharacterized protein RAG0_08557 [Rhynchosporium agropyri]